MAYEQEKNSVKMQIEEEPSTLTRSDHVENLDLAANTEEEGNGAVVSVLG